MIMIIEKELAMLSFPAIVTYIFFLSLLFKSEKDTFFVSIRRDSIFLRDFADKPDKQFSFFVSHVSPERKLRIAINSQFVYIFIAIVSFKTKS